MFKFSIGNVSADGLAPLCADTVVNKFRATCILGTSTWVARSLLIWSTNRSMAMIYFLMWPSDPLNHSPVWSMIKVHYRDFIHLATMWLICSRWRIYQYTIVSDWFCCHILSFLEYLAWIHSDEIIPNLSYCNIWWIDNSIVVCEFCVWRHVPCECDWFSIFSISKSRPGLFNQPSLICEWTPPCMLRYVRVYVYCRTLGLWI